MRHSGTQTKRNEYSARLLCLVAVVVVMRMADDGWRMGVAVSVSVVMVVVFSGMLVVAVTDWGRKDVWMSVR